MFSVIGTHDAKGHLDLFMSHPCCLTKYTLTSLKNQLSSFMKPESDTQMIAFIDVVFITEIKKQVLADKRLSCSTKGII